MVLQLNEPAHCPVRLKLELEEILSEPFDASESHQHVNGEERRQRAAAPKGSAGGHSPRRGGHARGADAEGLDAPRKLNSTVLTGPSAPSRGSIVLQGSLRYLSTQINQPAGQAGLPLRSTES